MAIDDEVFRRAASGNCDAQKMIYEHFGARVYRIARRVVGETDAADVVQDAFLHLFAKLRTFRFESEFATWLHRLVVNKALEHVRKRAHPIQNTVPLLEFESVRSDEESQRRDTAELIEKALSQVEPKLRLIFELKEIDELSYAEIAKIVGIPEGTVGSRLNRARKELREHLTQLGWES